MKKLLSTLLLFFTAGTAVAHPGGGLIALDANTVIFSDSMYNAVWRLERGKKPQALIRNFHAHWTVLGLDGHIYSESFGEMGGALFRIDLKGDKHVRIAGETDLKAPVFAVGKLGEIIFQQDEQIWQRSADGKWAKFRGFGQMISSVPKLRQVIAYTWAPDGTLYLADGEFLSRIGADGKISYVTQLKGTLLEPQIWNSTGSPRLWSIAIDDKGRIYTALPDLGQVVRIDPDRSQQVIDSYTGGWRVTAVATFADSVFLLESSDKTNAGQRVRVIRGTAKPELLGQVEP